MILIMGQHFFQVSEVQQMEKVQREKKVQFRSHSSHNQSGRRPVCRRGPTCHFLKENRCFFYHHHNDKINNDYRKAPSNNNQRRRGGDRAQAPKLDPSTEKRLKSLEDAVDSLHKQIQGLIENQNNVNRGMGTIHECIGQLARLASHAFLNALSLNFLSQEDTQLDEIRSNIYDSYRVSASSNEGLTSMDGDIVKGLEAIGTRVPALVNASAFGPLRPLVQNPISRMDETEQKFKNLVLCSEDIYKAKASRVLLNPKNNHKTNFKQKKLIVSILEGSRSFVDVDGNIINQDDIKRENQMKNVMDAVNLMSQQITQLQSSQQMATFQASQQASSPPAGNSLFQN